MFKKENTIYFVMIHTLQLSIKRFIEFSEMLTFLPA